MTESVESLQRMSASKAPDLLTRINTEKQIIQNTEFNLANQYEVKILSIITVMEIFSSIINIFVVIFKSKAFITSANVSYYFSIQLNPSIYIRTVLLLLQKKQYHVTELAIPIQIELILIQTRATDMNTIYKLQDNCCVISRNSDETNDNYAATIFLLITSNIISCTSTEIGSEQQLQLLTFICDSCLTVWLLLCKYELNMFDTVSVCCNFRSGLHVQI